VCVGVAVGRGARTWEAVDLVDQIVIRDGGIEEEDAGDPVGVSDCVDAGDETAERRPEQQEGTALTERVK
jgi:hypothetical protein